MDKQLHKEVPVLSLETNINASLENIQIQLFSEVESSIELIQNHTHEYFEIMWLKNGVGIHEIDLVEHEYAGSVMFVLAPGQIHKISPEVASEGYILRFDQAIFDHELDFITYIIDTCMFDSNAACPVIPVQPDLEPKLEEMFSNILTEYNQPVKGSINIISSYLKILITHINRLKQDKISKEIAINDPQYTLFRSFKILLEKEYKIHHDVQFYADALAVQPRTLNTAVKRFAEKSTLELIHERLLLEAQRSLFHEERNIKEISYKLGFEDPAYFTRFFKKHTGLAPQAFKAQLVA